MNSNRHRARKTGHRYEAPTPYFQFPLELIGSVALAALSLGARRVLDRLIIEQLSTWGTLGSTNGKLAVSYIQLAAHTGVRKQEIASALAELVDLGLIVIAHGRRPKGAAKTRPNFYRLTFLPDHEGVWPSEEWRRFEPSEGAGPIAWQAALARAKDIARAAHKRRLRTGRPFRTEEETDAAIKPPAILLKRLGKDKRIGHPGNKQTRAALNEVNGRRSHFLKGTDRALHWGTDRAPKNATEGTDRAPAPEGTDRAPPSTSSVHVVGASSEASEGREPSSSSMPDVDVQARGEEWIQDEQCGVGATAPFGRPTVSSQQTALA